MPESTAGTHTHTHTHTHTQKKANKPYKLSATPPVYFKASNCSESQPSTKVWCFVLQHCRAPALCQFVFSWLVGWPVNLAYILIWKDFIKRFHVWWRAKAFPWKSNQWRHNEQRHFFSRLTSALRFELRTSLFLYPSLAKRHLFFLGRMWGFVKFFPGSNL